MDNKKLLIGLGVVLYLITKSKAATPTGTSDITCTSGTATLDTLDTTNVIVSFTWTNNGSTTGTFIPKVKIDDVLTDLEIGVISLDPGKSYVTTKNLTLTSGTHTICPVPN